MLSFTSIICTQLYTYYTQYKRISFPFSHSSSASFDLFLPSHVSATTLSNWIWCTQRRNERETKRNKYSIYFYILFTYFSIFFCFVSIQCFTRNYSCHVCMKYVYFSGKKMVRRWETIHTILQYAENVQRKQMWNEECWRGREAGEIFSLLTNDDNGIVIWWKFCLCSVYNIIYKSVCNKHFIIFLLSSFSFSIIFLNLLAACIVATENDLWRRKTMQKHKTRSLKFYNQRQRGDRKFIFLRLIRISGRY